MTGAQRVAAVNYYNSVNAAANLFAQQFQL